RQHPELFQELEDTVFGAHRQRDDQHVDAGNPGEFDQFGDGAKLRVTGNDDGRTAFAAVIENAADADIVILLAFKRADQISRPLAAADDDGTPFHDAVSGPVADAIGKGNTLDEQEDDAGQQPGDEQARGINQAGTKQRDDERKRNEG